MFKHWLIMQLIDSSAKNLVLPKIWCGKNLPKIQCKNFYNTTKNLL